MLVSAGAEWRALLAHFPEADEQPTPYGNTFNATFASRRVQFLHGGSDLVDASAGEAYGNYAFFEEQCREIMAGLARHLPEWIKAFRGVN